MLTLLLFKYLLLLLLNVNYLLCFIAPAQVEEWQQFQCDLLTTVRVANDFKTEAQGQLEKVLQDNAALEHQLAGYDEKYPGN